MCARILGVLVFVMSISAAQAFAQDAPGIALGTRVRVEAATVSRKPVTGTIVKLDETSMTVLVNPASPPKVLPRDAITKMEVSVGRRSNAKLGALIGAAAMAISAASEDYSCSGFICVTPPKEAVVAFAGVVGAGLGALVGWAVGKDTWAPVVSSPTLTVTPTRKGARVSLSFAF